MLLSRINNYHSRLTLPGIISPPFPRRENTKESQSTGRLNGRGARLVKCHVAGGGRRGGGGEGGLYAVWKREFCMLFPRWKSGRINQPAKVDAYAWHWHVTGHKSSVRVQTRLHGDDYREIHQGRESAYSSACIRRCYDISYTCINRAPGSPDARWRRRNPGESWRDISWESTRTRILFPAAAGRILSPASPFSTFAFALAVWRAAFLVVHPPLERVPACAKRATFEIRNRWKLLFSQCGSMRFLRAFGALRLDDFLRLPRVLFFFFFFLERRIDCILRFGI